MKALMSCQGIQTAVMAVLRGLSSPPAVPRGFVLLLLSLGTLGRPGSGGENPRGEFLKKNELQLTYLPLCSEGQLDQKTELGAGWWAHGSFGPRGFGEPRPILSLEKRDAFPGEGKEEKSVVGSVGRRQLEASSFEFQQET